MVISPAALPGPGVWHDLDQFTDLQDRRADRRARQPLSGRLTDRRDQVAGRRWVECLAPTLVGPGGAPLSGLTVLRAQGR
jgi:hypothetical protein